MYVFPMYSLFGHMYMCVFLIWAYVHVRTPYLGICTCAYSLLRHMYMYVLLIWAYVHVTPHLCICTCTYSLFGHMYMYVLLIWAYILDRLCHQTWTSSVLTWQWGSHVAAHKHTNTNHPQAVYMWHLVLCHVTTHEPFSWQCLCHSVPCSEQSRGPRDPARAGKSSCTKRELVLASFPGSPIPSFHCKW